jgi:hypothetical protein
LGAFSQNAVNSVSTLSTAGVAKTTLTNTDTARATLPTVKLFYDVLTISASITKATGTLAGSAVLQATLDGTKWFNVSTTALSDGTNDLLFVVSGTGANGYRIQVSTSGTQTSTIANTKFIFKKKS